MAPLPVAGEWPADPQDAQDVRDDRIWIDGCFDFFHHGHAGVMLQARQLGKELYVGIHSDEAILDNKGPTVMNLGERVSAADACRWTTRSVPHAPYVTDLDWMSHYGCRYCVHGDDITSDSAGEDCYRYVKAAKRFKVVKRTPGISTTDLVGRMLLCTRDHFIKSLKDAVLGRESVDDDADDAAARATAAAMRQRLHDYATDATGLAPGLEVYMYRDKQGPELELFIKGVAPTSGQRTVYVDGGFDLFSSGHVEFLRSVARIEDARDSNTDHTGKPYFVIAGIHDDLVINAAKGLNYPIMNIFERGLCLLQCRYVDAVVFGAPFEPSEAFLRALPSGLPSKVYHGPTAYMPGAGDAYADARRLGVFEEVPRHAFQDVDASQIVARINSSRSAFEARQRAKGVKAVGEAAARQRELEAEAADKAEAQGQAGA